MDVVVASEELSDGSMSGDMFKTILKAYNNEGKWWVGVEHFLKNANGDFAKKVNCSSVFWHAQLVIVHLACR